MRQKKVVLTIAAIAATLIVGVGCFQRYKVYANAHTYTVPEGYHTEYVPVRIYSGDTLEEISKEVVIDNLMTDFCSVEQELNEIVRINEIQDKNSIKSGNYIVVPVVLTD